MHDSSTTHPSDASAPQSCVVLVSEDEIGCLDDVEEPEECDAFDKPFEPRIEAADEANEASDEQEANDSDEVCSSVLAVAMPQCTRVGVVRSEGA